MGHQATFVNGYLGRGICRSSMKRIGIYLQSGPACGGAYQYSRTLVEALCQLPTDQYELVAIYGAPHWQHKLKGKPIQSIYTKQAPLWQKMMGLWRRLKLPVALWRKTYGQWHPLTRQMKKADCDLWFFPSQDAFAYWLPVNAVGVVHDLMHRYESRFPEVGNKTEYYIREFHYQHTCRYAKGVLVDSPLGKQQLIDSYHIAENRCHPLPFIAPMGIDALKSNLSIDLPGQYLFYPAQFWQHKNHENLLKALKQSLTVCPDMQLVLVGSPKNYYSMVVDLIKVLNLQSHVHVLGLVEDHEMPALYRRARGLIMPTYFGPTNIPPLEAFALGCPVGISGIYGMPDQLGEAALYFNPESVDEIADVMQRLWQDADLCQQLIDKGYQHHQRWQLAPFAKRVEQIVRAIA